MQSRFSSFYELVRSLGRFLGRSWARVILIGLLSFCLLLVSFANGPDLELNFARRIPSDLEPIRLERNIAAINRWPQWFYSLGEAKLINSPTLRPGAILELLIDPKKGSSKRFSLRTQVLEYAPARLIRMKILEDSSRRLTHLFDSIEWTIELEPREQGSWIKGTVSAHTRNWRSRLFGHLSEKILMNQLFYPNLVKLSELRQPFAVDSGSPASGGTILPR